MWNVLRVEEFGGRWVFAQTVLRGWAGVHEGLCHHGQAGVRDAAFMNVEHKLGILDHVYPEAQRQAVNIGGQQEETVLLKK